MTANAYITERSLTLENQQSVSENIFPQNHTPNESILSSLMHLHRSLCPYFLNAFILLSQVHG